MIKFAMISHGWFLHIGRTALYQNAAKETLIRTLIPSIIDENDRQPVVYSAPEKEAIATAKAVATITNSQVIVDDSLSDKSGAGAPNGLITELLSAPKPSILVTHRRRLKALLRAFEAIKKEKLKIAGKRPFFKNQALLIDPDTMTVKVVSIE